MSYKVKNISINALRGIPELSLDLNGKNQVIRGDNGTGKSSLVDAIEFFFTGSISSLQGTQGLSLERHAPHVNFSPEQLKVSLSFDPGNINLSRTFNSYSNPPTTMHRYFAIAQKGTCILRRAQLLEFIISQPADRFRAISNIIGIQQLDSYELMLKGVRDHFSQLKDKQEIAVTTNSRNLKEILGTPVRTEEETTQALNVKLKQNKLPKLSSFADIDHYSESLLKTVRTTQGATRTDLFQKITASAKIPLPQSDQVIQSVKKANQHIRNLVDDQAKKSLALKNLLTHGQEIIKQWDIDACPLCGQTIALSELSSSLHGRLLTIAALSEDSSKATMECSAVETIIIGFKEQISHLESTSKQIPELHTETHKLQAIVKLISDFLESIDSGKKFQKEIPTEPIPGLFNGVQVLLAELSKKCLNLSEAEKITEQERSLLDTITSIHGAQTHFANLKKASDALKEAQKSWAIANYLYDTFVTVKKSKVQAVFNLIQHDIQNFYSILHPQDGHTNIKLRQPPARRASIEIKIDSFGQAGEDPRAFSSEGHLDSLGLCIFLAFVKKFNQDCSLVVLDDIVTTIDAKHRNGICNLLAKEFSDKQLFITTHDAYWLRQLRQFHRANGLEGQYDYRDIDVWDLNAGPVLLPFKLNWEKIEDKIRARDKTVATDGRIHLEWVLKQICEASESSVPFRQSGEYMIGDLLPAAKNRLMKLVAEEEFREQMKNAFQELESSAVCANLLSHDNVLSDDVKFEEISLFCGNVQNLYNLFTCPNCGNLLKYYRDLAIIRCPNAKCPNPYEIKTKT